MRECVIRLAIEPAWWATGARTWTVNPRRAFVFTDAASGSGPYSKAIAWASAHADTLRKELPPAKRDRLQILAPWER